MFACLFCIKNLQLKYFKIVENLYKTILLMCIKFLIKSIKIKKIKKL